jgi:hypothetical protein
MDQMIRANSYGEVGIDTEASPGNGQFYAKTYDGELDSVGFDTVEEAWAELELVLDCYKFLADSTNENRCSLD